MSVLAYPRIHFSGQFSAHTNTGNNNDVVFNLDAVTATLLPDVAALSDAGVAARFRDRFTQTTPPPPTPFTNSGWNLMGDMTTRFVGVTVKSVVGRDGVRSTTDPVVTAPIELLGAGNRFPVLCDQDPTFSSTTQLFAGGLTLGDGSIGMTAVKDVVCHSRWLTKRNVSPEVTEQRFVPFGATWQLAFPTASLDFRLPAAPGVLAELRDAAAANLGVLVNFCYYLALPSMTDEELLSAYAAGDNPRNPAVGFLVGTVGVWEPGDVPTAPDARTLIQARNVLAGPASARVQEDRDVVSLNLITAIPERDLSRPPNAKAPYGVVRLGVIARPGAAVQPVGGPIAYDYPDYASCGGIVDVPFDPAAVARADLESGSLVLTADGFPGGPILSEAAGGQRVLSDDRAVYLDVGESADVSVRVFDKGRPPDADVTLFIQEFQRVNDPPVPDTRVTATPKLVATTAGLTPRVAYPASVVFPAGRAGPVTFRVTALRQGPLTLTVTKFPISERQFGGALGSDAYGTAVFVRVMPEDSYDHIEPAVRTSWTFMYQTVFRYYHLVFPAMSQIIPFDDERSMIDVADALVAATDPALRGSTRYMPVSRDLSAGKRKLLIEWADAVRGR